MTYLLTFLASFLGCATAYGVKYLIERRRIAGVKKQIDAATDEMHKSWTEFIAEVNRHDDPNNNVVNFGLYKATRDED